MKTPQPRPTDLHCRAQRRLRTRGSAPGAQALETGALMRGASRREWLCRFADRMVEASDYEMSLSEAIRLGAAEYERWGHACPETLVERFWRICCRDQFTARAAAELAWTTQRTARPFGMTRRPQA